ncbi:RsbRD N-terminal domain-containing protein [Myxococcota bacterium]|nr:RsbRD N-terminal domain-containing protein [Myxococcota bacterium]
MTIHDLLREDEKTILEDAWRSVASLEHYERDGEAATRARLARLYHLVTDAVRTRDLTPMLDAVTEIARQRYESGFDLSEVQCAFHALETEIWKHVLAKTPPAELAEALGLVSTALGRGKDVLGTTYVSLASKSRAKTLDLSALFKGMQGWS